LLGALRSETTLMKTICQCEFNQKDEDAFWSQVDKDSADPCWIWKGGKNRDGYGVMWVGKRALYAHRIAS